MKCLPLETWESTEESAQGDDSELRLNSQSFIHATYRVSIMCQALFRLLRFLKESKVAMGLLSQAGVLGP